MKKGLILDAEARYHFSSHLGENHFMSQNHHLSLESLKDGIPVIPEEAAGFFKQNCMVCFHHTGHASGVNLTFDYDDDSAAVCVHWTGEITDQLLGAYRDHTRMTDFGACALALLLVRELTEYTAIEQAIIGTTVDYHLGSKNAEGDLIFNHVARLEVSGILKENEDNTVQARINRKLKRLKKDGDLPDLIAVVELGRPWPKMVTA